MEYKYGQRTTDGGKIVGMRLSRKGNEFYTVAYPRTGEGYSRATGDKLLRWHEYRHAELPASKVQIEEEP